MELRRYSQSINNLHKINIKSLGYTGVLGIRGRLFEKRGIIRQNRASILSMDNGQLSPEIT